jgi:predicted nucleotidyltransferase
VTGGARAPDAWLQRVARWAQGERDVRAVGLVGSHARGAARADSDVDLVLLAHAPERFLDDVAWTRAFGHPLRSARESWGRVTSLRVRYEGGVEVEFGWAEPGWAALPPDEGTRRVVQAGLRVVWDPDGLLARLAAACAR